MTIKIFNESDETENTNTTWSMDDIKDYVKQFMVYEQQISDLTQARSEWSAQYIKDKSLPKKELSQALKAVKSQIDMDIVNEIYDSISGMLSEE